MENAYIKLGSLLESINPDLKLKNHCYWRIANDNVFNERWDNVCPRPFYRNATDQALEKSVENLQSMVYNQDRIFELNTKSLKRRA